MPRLPLLRRWQLLQGGSPDSKEPEPSPQVALPCWSGPPHVIPTRLWRPQLPLNCLASPSRNLEQEISFDFGPNGEFAYLYSQCYELTTNECAPHWPAGRVG